ncbi:hypothetical protein C5167_027760 [Papaver somniferum]|nr:hypothetical protein C5167_027760 [Papaver somniferum]
MELVDDDEDYNLYWETNLFLQNGELELDSWGFDEPISVRVCRMQQHRLLLWIKASTIKDAIEYIQELHDQEEAFSPKEPNLNLEN